MPKWKKTKQTENKGIIKLKAIVNSNNCIYREGPGESDTGIDGFIEFVDAEDVTGQMIAVQVKTGLSYYNKSKEQFELRIEKDMLDYWKDYMLPVILFFYLPDEDKGCWISIREFIETEEYYNRLPVSKIKVSIKEELNESTFINLIEYARLNYDYKSAINWIDSCLDASEDDIFDNFLILSNHPYTRDNKITIFIARYLIKSDDKELLRETLRFLGYCIGRFRWSGNPGNSIEKDIQNYASKICSDLSENELYKLFCVIDDIRFSGPMALSERFFDLISCCFETASKMLIRVAEDKNEPFYRRASALYLFYECDDDIINEEFKAANYDESLTDIFEEIIRWCYKM
jgi:hypothetical protein